jgi:hypothetical protein
MEIHGFEVEARAAASEDGAFAGWCGARFGGVVPVLAVLVPSLDAALAEVPGTEVAGEHGRVARVADVPGGVPVELVEPAPPGSHEVAIDEFVAGAADLPGGPTEELADAVLEVLAGAWSQVDALFEGVAHNKVLATMLLLGQRARASDVETDSPLYWQRSAASTLASGFVTRGAASG